jgi:hypothetical protein
MPPWLYRTPIRPALPDRGWTILYGWAEIAARMRTSVGAAQAFFKKHGIPRGRQGTQVKVSTGMLDRALWEEGIAREEMIKQKFARGEWKGFLTGHRIGEETRFDGTPLSRSSQKRKGGSPAPTREPSVQEPSPQRPGGKSSGRGNGGAVKPNPRASTSRPTPTISRPARPPK